MAAFAFDGSVCVLGIDLRPLIFVLVLRLRCNEPSTILAWNLLASILLKDSSAEATDYEEKYDYRIIDWFKDPAMKDEEVVVICEVSFGCNVVVLALPFCSSRTHS